MKREEVDEKRWGGEEERRKCGIVGVGVSRSWGDVTLWEGAGMSDAA